MGAGKQAIELWPENQRERRFAFRIEDQNEEKWDGPGVLWRVKGTVVLLKPRAKLSEAMQVLKNRCRQLPKVAALNLHYKLRRDQKDVKESVDFEVIFVGEGRKI